MEIRDIIVKLDKVERALSAAQKAGDQAKSWAAIGEQHGV